MYAEAHAVLMYWLSLRPGLLESFASVEPCEYPWAAGPKDTDQELADMHACGVYFYCKLKQWKPPPRADIDVVTARSSSYRNHLTSMIHAAPMYSVHRTILKGIFPGPIPGKSGLVGVFSFETVGRSAAASSSGYAVYSWIGGSYLASPRYDIAAELYRAGEEGIGQISAGNGQKALKPGMYFLRGVFFHVLTRSDVARGPPTWCYWDDWHPEYEMPLDPVTA